MKARYVFRALKARYRDQRSELDATLATLHSGDVVVDVGANKGAYLYWLRAAVGLEGKVFAFEPQKSLADYLASVVKVMKWKNVVIRDCALSDHTGTAILHVPGEGDSPSASLSREVLDGQAGRRQECRLETLDRQLEGSGRVALVKVDVEGNELQVFRGGQGVLKRDKPVLLFECEQRHLAEHSMEDVFEYLEQLGYEGSFFSPQGLRPLGDFDPAVHQRRQGERYWDAPGYCNNFRFQSKDAKAIQQEHA